MQRRGYSREEIQALRSAFQILFGELGTLAERVDEIAGKFPEAKTVQDIVAFIRADSSRAICQPKGNGG
jgi:UDP-N-acetylglucosamine acyltransferase